MANSTTIGIDIGTTAVKAAVVSNNGEINSTYSETYGLTRCAGGIAEQNPNDWVRIITQALSKFESEGHGSNTEGVGICSQVNTHVFVDILGEPLFPAILWQDGRASAEALELDALVSDEQKISWWGTPMPIDASHALPRMLWVIRNHPELWEQTRYVMLPKDYCIYKLTRAISTDALSNIGLVDNQLKYISALFDLVPNSIDRMAPLQAITNVVGTINSGLPCEGKTVVNGTMDAWAGLVGAGGAKQNSTVYLSGTSEILGISSPNVNPINGAIVFPECCGIRLHAGPTQNGGDAKKWFTESFSMSFESMSELVANNKRSPATPLFLPQLEGERAPLWDSTLRGAFLGVSRQTKQQDFARAVYEGVSMAALWVLETLQSSSGVSTASVFCGGNGFKSDAWAQIRADVLGAELHRLAVSETGVLGSAMIAFVATGECKNIDDAASALSRTEQVFTPDSKRHAHYGELFELYKSSINITADINSRIAKASAGFG